ncbi:Camp-specific 3', partial [Globisporangium splendens]
MVTCIDKQMGFRDDMKVDSHAGKVLIELLGSMFVDGLSRTSRCCIRAMEPHWCLSRVHWAAASGCVGKRTQLPSRIPQFRESRERKPSTEQPERRNERKALGKLNYQLHYEMGDILRILCWIKTNMPANERRDIDKTIAALVTNQDLFEVSLDPPMTEYEDEAQGWLHMMAFKEPPPGLTRASSRLFSDRRTRRTSSQILQAANSHLTAFIGAVKNHYFKRNPYHNCLHAGAVVADMNFFLRRLNLDVDGRTFFVGLIAAAAHDISHPGVNNGFLVATKSKLAITYSGDSVLERMHIAELYRILSHDKFDVFSHMTLPVRGEIRKSIIQVVLATDLSRHFVHVSKLKSKKFAISEETKGLEVTLIMETLLMLSDLGHTVKPFAYHQVWANRILEEFFHQGETEERHNLPVLPLCDRRLSNFPKSQVTFLTLLASPLFETTGQAFAIDEYNAVMKELHENIRTRQGMIGTCENTSPLSRRTHAVAIYERVAHTAIWCAHLRRMDSDPIESTAEMAIMMTRLEAGMRNLTRLAEAQAGDSDGHTVAAVLKAYVDCFLSQTDAIPLTPSDTRGVYLLFFDGGSRGNPGPGGTGSIIVRVHKDSHTASLIWAASMAYSRKDTTNNFAEYWGLIHGLREAQRSHFEPLYVIGDSALIISQQRMHRSPRQHRLARLYQTSRRLADCIDIRGWYHHYRAFNKMADSAANLAMDTRTSTQVHFPTQRAAFNNLTQDLDNDVMHWLMRSSEDPRSLDNTRQPHIGPREHAILVKDYLAFRSDLVQSAL